MTTKRLAASVAVLGVALALAWMLLRPTAVPPLTLTLLNGEKRTLSELRGKPVLLAFWATTCPPCVREAPDLAQLYNTLRAHGFTLIAIAAPYDPPAQVLAFSQRHALPYPVALDLTGEATRAFKVTAIPRAFLLDARGHVVLDHTGAIDIAAVQQQVMQLLEEAGANKR